MEENSEYLNRDGDNNKENEHKSKSDMSCESIKVDKEVASSVCKDDSYISDWLKENNTFRESLTKNITTHGGLLKNTISASDTNISKKSTFSKIFHWDPWMKIRRKSKKNKKKNEFTVPEIKLDYDSSDSSNCNTSTYNHGEPSNTYSETYRQPNDMPPEEEDTYPRWQPSLRKKVQFQTDVRVIHFSNERILCHTVEPLKKELEQQMRNIRLRKEKASEALDGIRPKSKKSVSNYMSAWCKR